MPDDHGTPKPWTLEVGSDEEFEVFMDATQVFIRLTPGQTLTEDEVAALRFYDAFQRRDEERAIDAFHKGYEEGLRHSGGDALVRAVEAKGEAQAREATARAMRAFDRQKAFREGAQACRAMMADFVEQGGDPITANSIRLNWNPEWGLDPDKEPADAR